MCKTRLGSQGVILDVFKQKNEKTFMELKTPSIHLHGKFHQKFPFCFLNTSLITTSNWIAMEILRDFLESTTIHGLTYVSAAKVSYYWSVYFTFRMPLRQSLERSLGLELFALASLALQPWSASRIRSGRSTQLPRRSPPTPSRTSTSPKWPFALQGTPTQHFTMILWNWGMELFLKETGKLLRMQLKGYF